MKPPLLRSVSKDELLFLPGFLADAPWLALIGDNNCGNHSMSVVEY